MGDYFTRRLVVVGLFLAAAAYGPVTRGIRRWRNERRLLREARNKRPRY